MVDQNKIKDMAVILGNYLKTSEKPMKWSDYLCNTDTAKILIAEWWDESRPVLYIEAPAEKISETINDFSVSPLTKNKQFGHYCIAGFQNERLASLNFLGSHDAIRFVACLLAGFDLFLKKNPQAVPVLRL